MNWLFTEKETSRIGDWSYASTFWKCLETLKARRTRKGLPQEPPKGALPCQYLCFNFWPPVNVRE